MCNCRTKLMKLLCLKYFGRMLQNSAWFCIIKPSPSCKQTKTPVREYISLATAGVICCNAHQCGGSQQRVVNIRKEKNTMLQYLVPCDDVIGFRAVDQRPEFSQEQRNPLIVHGVAVRHNCPVVAFTT